MAQDSLVEKVIFRLIKKHISGPTMGSAIERAKQFNARSIPVSINFISQSPPDKAKANYITTTYLQLVREISRLGINASVHLRLDQLGSTISQEEAIENLNSILAVSSRYGVFVWCELSNPSTEFPIVNQVKETSRLGLSFTNIEDGMVYSKKSKRFGSIKVSCRGKHDGEKELKSDPMDSIEQIASSAKSLVLLEPKESSVSKLMKKGGKYRKSLIFEFQLGYAENRLGKLLKRGAPLSVFVPFGKDWASYAMNNVPHKYMRVLASNLLSEAKEEKSE
ncbi:MAG: hypothetical protein KGH71_00720 [Candidatus Micrarchaeota archaeon]|nr:hypothetical protein [Candidatus Micrarchaeota archaeon]